MQHGAPIRIGAANSSFGDFHRRATRSRSMLGDAHRSRRCRHDRLSERSFSSRCQISRARTKPFGPVTGAELFSTDEPKLRSPPPYAMRIEPGAIEPLEAIEPRQKQQLSRQSNNRSFDRAPLDSPTRYWWSQTGSNRRPPACKAGALPTELWPLQGGNRARVSDY
jgi:hypothetical protein